MHPLAQSLSDAHIIPPRRDNSQHAKHTFRVCVCAFVWIHVDALCLF